MKSNCSCGTERVLDMGLTGLTESSSCAGLEHVSGVRRRGLGVLLDFPALEAPELGEDDDMRATPRRVRDLLP